MATYTSNYGWTKPSGSDNVDISVLNNNLDDQDSTIHDAFLNMAPPFSESSTYAVDDIVLYDTGLYKCHTAVVTPGSWTGSTNWQVYKLSEGGGGGTSNYNDLTNKPSINGVTLSGNKTTSDLGLQDELTFDNVPTDGSDNPVKSDGIYGSEKGIYAVMGQMGAKNLIPYPYKETTKTENGITFTDNGDGTITSNGTATGDATIMLYQNSVSLLKAGRYILSGCPEGGGTNIYKIQAAKNDWTFGGADYGAGVVLNITNESTQQIQLIRILVSSGKTVSNLTFKPMLRLASDTDDTYQPYAKTNKELTESYPANKVMMSDGMTSVEDALADLSDLYTIVSSSLEFLGALSANASGYVENTITIPAGYVTTPIYSVTKLHPGDAPSLQISMTHSVGRTGNITVYLSYFTMAAVATGSSDYKFNILCKKVS